MGVHNLWKRVAGRKSTRSEATYTLAQLFSENEFERLITDEAFLDEQIQRSEATLISLLNTGTHELRALEGGSDVMHGRGMGKWRRARLALPALALAALWPLLGLEPSILFAGVAGILVMSRPGQNRLHIPVPVAMASAVRDGRDAQFAHAIQLCRESQYEAAASQLRALAHEGHAAAVYTLALLHAAADAADEEARRLFVHLLATAPEYRIRATVGLAILLAPTDGGEWLRTLREVAQESEPRRNGERQAWLNSVTIVEAADRATSLHPSGCSALEIETLKIVAFARRQSSRHRVSRRLQREIATATSRLITLALEAGGSDGAVFTIVPVDIFPLTSGWRERRLRVPVLQSDHPETDPYPFPFISAVSRFLIVRGVRGLLLSVLSLTLCFGASLLLALGNPVAAAGVLTCATLLDAVDGRVAQLSSRDVGRGLFGDYVVDRIGDIALGLGFSAWVLSTQQSVHLLVVVQLFIAGCLLASYLRAEAERFALDGDGGPIERPHRAGLVILALAVGLPVGALYVGTACAWCSVATRLVRAARTKRSPMSSLTHRSKTWQSSARALSDQSQERGPHHAAR